MPSKPRAPSPDPVNSLRFGHQICLGPTMQYGPTAYRDLVTAPSANPIAGAWNKAACRTPSLWERIRAEGNAFVLALEDGRVLPLASFADADLVPDLPSLSGMGDWAVKHSLAARIL